MTQRTRIALCACALALAVPALGAAQSAPAPETRAFVSVSFGYQAGARDLTESGTFALYDETGSYAGTGKISSGFLFDVGGGYRIRGPLFVGVAYSRFSDTNDANYLLTVPHPIFYDQPRTVNTVVPNLVHTVQAIHMQALYTRPLREKLDLSVFGGPSVFMVKQDQVPEFTALESGNSVTMTGTIASVSKTVVGVNVGGDITYMVTPKLGVGMFVRYAAASVDLGGGWTKFTVGGVQGGLGLRARF